MDKTHIPRDINTSKSVRVPMPTPFPEALLFDLGGVLLDIDFGRALGAWVAWSKLFPGVVGAFDRIFSSHEMGLRKPERAAFDRICTDIGAPAASIVFFDDSVVNVQAAKGAGLQSVLVRSPKDVALALRPLHRRSQP